MEYIGYFIIAILALVVLVKIFAWPLAILTKLIINGRSEEHTSELQSRQ